MNKSIKVLHILSGFGMGGAETWMLEIVKYISKHPEKNYPKMEFLCTSGEKAALDDEILKYGGVIHYITLNKKTVFSFISQYRKLLKQQKYIAIHDHQDFLSGWHFLLGFGTNPNIKIAHVHNPSYQIKSNYGESFRHRVVQKMGHFLITNLSTYITGTSLQVLGQYGFDTDKSNVFALHCSFDLNNYELHVNDNSLAIENFDDKKRIILFVGRLDKRIDLYHPRNHKNSLRTINIFNKITNKDTVLLMVGDNTGIKEDYLNYIKELNLNERVHLLGLRNDVPQLMQQADILLFPSRAEGLGMVAVEAQASNLHVVASSAVPKECVVIEELIDFIDLDKTDEEWASSIDKRLNEPKKQISKHDSKWLNSDFNIQNSVDKLKQLYTQNVND